MGCAQPPARLVRIWLFSVSSKRVFTSCPWAPCRSRRGLPPAGICDGFLGAGTLFEGPWDFSRSVDPVRDRGLARGHCESHSSAIVNRRPVGNCHPLSREGRECGFLSLILIILLGFLPLGVFIISNSNGFPRTVSDGRGRYALRVSALPDDDQLGGGIPALKVAMGHFASPFLGC